MATIKHWQIGSETDRPIIRGSVRRLTEEEHRAEQRELERKAKWRGLTNVIRWIKSGQCLWHGWLALTGLGALLCVQSYFDRSLSDDLGWVPIALLLGPSTVGYVVIKAIRIAAWTRKADGNPR